MQGFSAAGFAFARRSLSSALSHMFANLVQLIAGRPVPEVARNAFVADVRVHHAREQPNPRVERVLLVCWALIAVKHVVIIWACEHYPVPFHQLWVNFPTWLLGALATGIYFGRMHGAKRVVRR
jgi:hypothetical protein